MNMWHVRLEAVGEYDYVYRYSTICAASWVYAYQDGLRSDPYTPDNAGDLTRSPPQTLPCHPGQFYPWIIERRPHRAVLTEASDDVAVYAYDLYRSTDGVSFAKLARILAPELTQGDESVETGLMYYYKVVSAVDTSFTFATSPTSSARQLKPNWWR